MMDTVYSNLIKKKVFKYFHATSFVTKKDEDKKISLTNIKIRFKRNNYDSMLALSNFVSDLKENKISSSMLKEILDNRKNTSNILLELRNKFLFQLIILSITAMGIMWGWGIKTQDDLVINEVNSVVSVRLSDKSKKEKEQIENRVDEIRQSYLSEKIWSITALNYIMFFLMVFCGFFL